MLRLVIMVATEIEGQSVRFMREIDEAEFSGLSREAFGALLVENVEEIKKELGAVDHVE